MWEENASKMKRRIRGEESKQREGSRKVSSVFAFWVAAVLGPPHTGEMGLRLLSSEARDTYRESRGSRKNEEETFSS